MNQTIIIAAFVMLFLLFMKAPVFIAVLSGSVSYFMLNPNMVSQVFAQRVISGIESTPLLAVPFFVASGVFMNYSGVTKRVMEFCSLVTRRLPGGLGQVNVLLSTLMGGLSGSNLADAAMQSKMIVPEMEKRGYSKEFSSVVTATSAMITPLIPPGIAMILYGSIANLSIGRLFMAGIGPGMLLCIALMILVGIISKKRGYEVNNRKKITSVEFFHALKGAFLPLCLPIIIISGIRLGIFTPTEAGAVSIIYALLLAIVYREMTVKQFMIGIKETICTTASVMIIVAAASAFAWILTRERIPQQFTAFMIANIQNKYVFLFIVNIFLIIVGMFIEGNASMIVLVPLLAPVANTYGIDPIQFAMIFIFNNAIGALSPPMGTLMFVTCGITKCKINRFIREAVPFYILLLICLALLTLVPAFSVGVVNLLWK